MSERLNATDIALARRMRALEAANEATIRASADLITTMLDAKQARSLPAKTGHDTLMHLGMLMTQAMTLQDKSVHAHDSIATLGANLGLPVTALGDGCQRAATFFTDMKLVEQAA